MAYAGQVIENPVSGERITFLQTSADTEGELVAIDLELPADGKVPGMHVHPIQEERFEVLEGTMGFTLGWKTVVAEPGEVVVVPPGVRHGFANAREDRAPRPGRDPAGAQDGAAVRDRGRAGQGGPHVEERMPKPLELALFVREFEQEVRAPFPPAPVVRATLAPWPGWPGGAGAAHATRGVR